MVVIGRHLFSSLVDDEVHSGAGLVRSAMGHWSQRAPARLGSGDDGRDGAFLETGSAERAIVLLRYAIGTAVATAVIVAGGYFVLRSVAIDEAKRNTRTKVVESGQLVESALADGLVAGDAAARRAIDDLVVARVLSGSIVRVKIWSQDGRVLYSDDPGQVGDYVLGDDELRSCATAARSSRSATSTGPRTCATAGRAS